MCRQLIDYFKGKSVLILGYGREGQSTFNFIRKHYPSMHLSIADKKNITVNDDSLTLHTGEHYLDCINDYDIVMQSPGISLRSVKINQNTEICGQMDLFLRFAPCQKIGITGTKGKTTTSTLIYEMIKASGKKCCLIGNMGIPVFDSLEDLDETIAVIEMSSHQLEFTKSSPHIAVLTNIYPEHLDHYNGFDGYVSAKMNIVNNQNEDDYFIYNPDQNYDALFLLDLIKSRKVPVSIHDKDNNSFLQMLTTLNGKLKGNHNFQDIFFAVNAVRCIGVSDEAIVSGIKNFAGIAHRMEEVGTWKGITFYNDSIATIPHAVLCAVEALQNVDTLILGGMDRGIDYHDFIKDLSNTKISNIIGLPETGHKIICELSQIDCKKNLIIVDAMDEAVKEAYTYTKKDSICLFSPAASSYNRYKNFEEKGNHFKALCKSFGEK